MSGLVLRELRQAAAGGAAMLPVVFFLLVATLFPFAVGPDASLRDERGRRRPMTAEDVDALLAKAAQGGLQMGHYAGARIARETSGRATPADRKPFVYRDKGSMAVIGKAKAVAQIGRLEVGGFVAWFLWGAIHIAFLIGFRNRVQVLLSWFWNWLLNARDARLITGGGQLDLEIPRPADFVATEVTTDVARIDGEDIRREPRVMHSGGE